MAKFTRKEIRDIIGEACTDDIENRIMALHLGVVDPMKDDIAKYKAAAEQLGGVQKELDDLKAKGGDFKAKYEQAKKELDDYKADVTAKETKAAKAKAIKKYVSKYDFNGKKIREDNLDIAMMALEDKIDSLELDGDEMKETPELKSLVSNLEKLSASVVTQGAQTATPPNNTGGNAMTKADIFKKDESGRYILPTDERQKAIATHLDLFNRR